MSNRSASNRRAAPAIARTIRSLGIAALFCTAATVHAQPDSAEVGPVGHIAFLVDPPDARITLHPATDGLSEPATLPVGHYLAEVSRPGYAPTLAGFTVAEGEDVEVAVELKRTSAAVRLRTAPSDATILIDGFERGRTPGQAEPGFNPAVVAASVPRAGSSRALWIGDLAAGSYRLEVRKEGFRSYSRDLDITGPLDFELPPVVLESQQAFLLLKGLPEDARVYGNGRELRPDREKVMAEASVSPGRVDLVVSSGVHSYFETSLLVEDGDWLEVPVELRPSLAYLGVFGEDAAGLRAVSSILDVIREEGSYIVLDREREGAAALGDLAIDPSILREGTAAKNSVDWGAVQARVQEHAPAALYLAAVLSDDLVAETADLWWWSAAPGPSRPDVLTIEIRDGRIGSEARRRLARSLKPGFVSGSRAPLLGAVLIETLTGEALVVASVDASGPAAAAGLQPGMDVVEINGVAAFSTGQVSEALQNLRPGGAIELAIGGPEGTSTLAFEPEWGWTGLDVFAPDLMSSVAASRLIREIERPGDVPRWLLELDLGALLLAAGDASGAVRLLETIDAPDRDGLGMGTVQYALGLAMSDLAAEGQGEYGQRARQIFRALASAAEGRVEADGGPSAAARARLQLGTEDQN